MSNNSASLHQSLSNNSNNELFVDNISCAIMSNLNKKSEIYNIIKEIRKNFNLKEELSGSKKHHITLHVINFNKSHPLTSKVKDNLKKITKECYEKTFNNIDFIFNGYYVYDNFFVMKLKPSKQFITDFRMCLYNNIKSLLKIKLNGPDKHNKYIYYISENDNTPLYGLNEKFYYGKDNWEPHISLFKLNEKIISDSNKTVKEYIEEKGGDLQNIKSIESIFDTLKPVENSIGFNTKNFFDIVISSYGKGIKNKIETIKFKDVKTGKKTKKLKSALKRGNKKTKKKLKVHFKPKIKVIKFKSDEKSNTKNKENTELISYGKKNTIKKDKKKKSEEEGNKDELVNRFKKGDKVMVYSNSNNEWCNGEISYIKGNNVSVNFSTKKNPNEILTKLVPINSKDIKFAKKIDDKNDNNNFSKKRVNNTELHPNEIDLQMRNNNAKIKKGMKVKKQRFVKDYNIEKEKEKEEVKDIKKEKESFGAFSWDAIMLIGALIAPIYVYKDIILNV